MFKIRRSLTQKLWVKLTMANIAMLAAVVILTGFTLYRTACFLASNVAGVEGQTQTSFNSTLSSYVWIITLLLIIVGAFFYSVITKRMLEPVNELSRAIQTMKKGEYPTQLIPRSQDEIGELVHHVNHLNFLLEQQESSRNQMLHDLSHELRTPLSNLQGYLEALNKGVIQGDQDIYKSLAEETERVTQLVQGLDEVKKWGRNDEERPMTKQYTVMDKFILQIVQLFEIEYERRGIDLIVHASPEVIMMNQQGIQQVVTNLLNNALHYYQGHSPVEVKGESGGSFYTLTVSGPGQPIPTSDQNKIFERFYQVDPSRTRNDGGSGLGLAISKEIVEKHGGEIWLETDGTRHSFHVQLPLNT
ncbi:two-component sensor histidine kinase [Halobacillus halophilus]|uniref:histidine kinase n=1 Tax=Halobacillus halophilus (strain ATCC 35676 / DSM 2266 / JCM 20832 / KCTC 3685 / LMG 17431 / NBRC 102448 / NCIMB 2269) TaxID=866895 RepID=I0JIH4_HALH3|nr:two-component sensor histidine kinase [Halobacillus halophilus]CCG43942.1 two-component sensor histidine kinase [Halobacillus halophilus DSM 2266]